MAIHSFRFFYNNKFYYPAVEVIDEASFNIHLYEPLEEFSLPQTFRIDLSLERTELSNDKATLFLKELKMRLVEHLIAIKILETSLKD